MAERDRRPAFLDLAALSVCLLGLIGLIYAVGKLKAESGGVSRTVFLVFLGMVCAPFYLAFVRIPKLPFLIVPVVVVFLLYPIATPHGVVYGTDPIFNFSFASQVLNTGFWSPGTGRAFADTYSFYPVGNVFLGYLILSTPISPAVGYIWVEPMLRLLALPATAYSIGRRIAGPRAAVLGVLFYLGTPSILFNSPVQQGMGVVFVALAFLSLLMLTQAPSKPAQRRAQILFALTSAGLIMTHHLSSYVFAFWLAGLAVLLARATYRPSVPPVRYLSLFAYFVAILLAYIVTFTYPIFFGHYQTLDLAIVGFIAGGESSGTGAPLGRTFSTIEQVWLAGSLFVLVLLAFLSVGWYRKTRQQPFVVANGLIAAILILATLPLIATPLNYVPLRIGEYAGLFTTPLAAATLIRWTRSDFGAWARRRIPAFLREKKWVRPAAAAVLASALFMGGNLAPITMRMYFESPSNRSTDSPLFLGQDSLRAADWSLAHFRTSRMWGDSLAVDVFGGFGDMRFDFGSTRVFANTTVDAGAWTRLVPGDYVAVDRFMLTYRVDYLHEPLTPTNFTLAQVEKFARDPHFALVYEDATFSIYRVVSHP